MDNVLFARVGVERLTAGRLKAAGSMSGMMRRIGDGTVGASGYRGADVACGESATRDGGKCS